jgi:hypothetical protein
MEEALKHFQSNLPTFQLWIDTNARLQWSSDILQPLIKPFKEANPSVNVHGGCQDCIIDMLMWYKIELSKSQKPETKPKK